ncbi:MAG: preprotein translocase subunit YajC [Alphaproteobacteria bacterium]
MFISEAFAQAGGAATQGSLSGTLIQLGLIFVIFYFLLIRPQQKKLKQHEQMLDAVKKGDRIITGGGIYAKVVKADSNSAEMVVEIASGVEVTINRGTIRDVVSDEVKADIKPAKASKAKAANSNKKVKG